MDHSRPGDRASAGGESARGDCAGARGTGKRGDGKGGHGHGPNEISQKRSHRRPPRPRARRVYATGKEVGAAFKHNSPTTRR